jgi:hypothetical protein
MPSIREKPTTAIFPGGDSEKALSTRKWKKKILAPGGAAQSVRWDLLINAGPVDARCRHTSYERQACSNSAYEIS